MRSWEVCGTYDNDPFWAALESGGITREDYQNMFVEGSHRYPCDVERCTRCERIRRQ